MNVGFFFIRLVQRLTFWRMDRIMCLVHVFSCFLIGYLRNIFDFFPLIFRRLVENGVVQVAVEKQQKRNLRGRVKSSSPQRKMRRRLTPPTVRWTPTQPRRRSRRPRRLLSRPAPRRRAGAGRPRLTRTSPSARRCSLSSAATRTPGPS